MSRLFKNGLSLKTQVYGLIIVISVVSFVVRVVTDVETTRDYLQTQMGSHAQDTATSLGLSISPYLDPENLVIAETMATAIFDSGYYKEIKFTNSQSQVVFDLENPKRVESVPNWFIALSSLKAPTMQSELNNGWIMAG
ncbi:LapD/MoxY N-terminal periplasmic domain-containing protein, partial [Pseudoalteromonas sp. AC163]